ncbi:phosphate/phosphite/phosphonate ABC transporter substrate-binding protein [Halorussus halophilus]|uniref:phosphate/phosphite/phosphonate ABC transporter substrate-binding protein n=1 Tax=Halorussus halophilus TaxID=2650975 RepID=UPI001300DFC3|nr:phosphate/phosphite/phosphonate ABC transporter substrate-binding protein [Halorussus halophilus]
MENRREFLKSTGAVSVVGLTALSGCMGGDGSGSDGTTEDDSTTSGDGTTSGGDTTTQSEMDFQNGEVNMNVSPSVAQESLQAQYKPIKNHLSDKLGLPATMQLANDYSAVIEALSSGTSDVAETGPFAAALGVKSDKAEIILQRKGYGSWTYKSLIAVPKDSDISKLSDLKGKTVAFADRLSASGALYPLYNLKTEGGLSVGNLPEGAGGDADFEPNFTGGHEKSYAALKAGQVDAAGFGGFIPGIAEDYEANAKTIHTQEGLPRAPIVVSPQLSDKEKQAITDAFTGAPDKIYYGEDGEKGTDDDLWFNAVREAGVDQYQGVIDVANELGVGQDIFKDK